MLSPHQEDCELFNLQELAAENLALHDSIANFAVDTIILLPDGSFEVQLSNGTTFTQVLGCTDPADVNYNAAANTDDCSCASACCSIEFEGYTYLLTEIGDQCWFSENLRTTVYADGTEIPEEPNILAWDEFSTGAHTVYPFDTSNLATYGRLYNWYAVKDAAGLCPTGWHVPTDGDWAELKYYVASQGFTWTVGTALKSTTGWNGGDNGTDDFGFSGLPGGGLTINPTYYYDVGLSGKWWSSSPSGPGLAFFRYLEGSVFNRAMKKRHSGLAVRCLRDADGLGCTDPAYTEYDAAANTDDGSCSTLVVEGCTDPAYTEYDAAANTDDGSCSTLVVEGCTDPAFTEYNASADTDDGSCSTLVVEGCTDPAFTEYNASANTDDGSCSTLVVEGCTYPAFTEYNASANTDDGSCATAVVEGCMDSDLHLSTMPRPTWTMAAAPQPWLKAAWTRTTLSTMPRPTWTMAAARR